MPGKWPKVIRDPIHNLITFEDAELDRLLFELIHCREFQRLRRIKQLGFCDMVFPGTTHTRFAHSIGVMWNARMMVAHLRKLDRKYVLPEQEIVVVVAALLHDVGHGPFSHAFEKVTNVKHEWRTVEILLSGETEVNKALSDFESELPFKVATLFPEGLNLLRRQYSGDFQLPDYLKSIVSSQLDADRFDYLLRDSHYSGTEYGRFDLPWLVGQMRVDIREGHDRIYLKAKGHHAVEEYIFARYHMYQSVYYHKATRSAEVMLKLFFRRLGELLREPDTSDEEDAKSRMPSDLAKAFAGELSLKDFLPLDDGSVVELIKRMTQASNMTLSYLARGLLDRRLLKCFDATHPHRARPDFSAQFDRQVRDLLAREGNNLPIEPDYAFEQDLPSDTPYKPFDPDDEVPETQIYVEVGDGKNKILREHSDLVGALSKKTTLDRYYFPEQMRDSVLGIANVLLGRTA